MSAIDTSVLVSICLEEDGCDTFESTLRAEDHVIGTCVLQEASMVLTSVLSFVQASAFLHRLVLLPNLSIADFGEREWRVGAEAFDRYGKGRHPARLNFGDCMSYAVAKVRDEPLLFKGDDFGHTDLALPPASVLPSS